MSVSSEIIGQQPAGGGGAGGASSGGGGAGQNTSRVQIQNRGANRFWETLVKNIEEILRETDKVLPTRHERDFFGGRPARGTRRPSATRCGCTGRNAAVR